MAHRRPHLLLLLNETSSRVWRIFPYAAFMRDVLGWEVRQVESNDRVSEELLNWADVILQELGLNYLIPKLARKYGKVFIYDIDDLVSSPPKNHPDYAELSRPIVRARTWATIHYSHVLLTSNQYLANHYRLAGSKEVHIIPNYMDLNYWQQPYTPNTTNTVRIGWVGSPSHYEDLKFVEPVIARILKEYPNTKFVYCGSGVSQRSVKHPEFEYQIGKDIFNLIPDDRREYVMGVPWKDYPARLASLQLDIGLAPVMETPFGKAKTPIKWYEYGINRIATIASDHLYGWPSIRSGHDGIAVANRADEWYSALKRLVELPAERKRMGEHAFSRITEDFNIDDHVYRWARIVSDSLRRYNPDFATYPEIPVSASGGEDPGKEQAAGSSQ